MLFRRKKAQEQAKKALHEDVEVTDKYNLVLSNLDLGIQYAKQAREKLQRIQEMIPVESKK